MIVQICARVAGPIVNCTGRVTSESSVLQGVRSGGLIQPSSDLWKDRQYHRAPLLSRVGLDAERSPLFANVQSLHLKLSPHTRQRWTRTSSDQRHCERFVPMCGILEEIPISTGRVSIRSSPPSLQTTFVSCRLISERCESTL